MKVNRSHTTMSEEEVRPRDLLEGQTQAYMRDVANLQKMKPGFVKIDCPACASSVAHGRFEKFYFNFVECEDCGTIYMSPRPTPEIMAQYYQNSENYKYWAEFIFPRSERTRKEKLYKPRVAKLREICEKRGISGRSLLEIGAGFGAFAEVAQKSGDFDEVVVLEPTPELATACKARGLRVLEKRVEEIEKELPPIDILVSFEVLEHLFAPVDFFHQAKRLLKPGGLLLVTCPNGKGFDVDMLGPLSTTVDSEHVNLFNPKSLYDMFASNGFYDIEIETPGKLDAELVRNAVLSKKYALRDPFLKRVLVEDWPSLGGPFQLFLADNGLSSHMWGYAQRS